jgi:hypothetical protein
VENSFFGVYCIVGYMRTHGVWLARKMDMAIDHIRASTEVHYQQDDKNEKR